MARKATQMARIAPRTFKIIRPCPQGTPPPVPPGRGEQLSTS
jgi:hypothetical protein